MMIEDHYSSDDVKGAKVTEQYSKAAVCEASASYKKSKDF